MGLHRINIQQAWRRIHRSNLAGICWNPAAVDPHHPKAPKHRPHPPGHRNGKPKTPELAGHVVYWANRSLTYAGRMVYTMDWTRRQELFSRDKGDFNGAHADCSQYVSTILHWLGVKSVNQTDYTGTLWNKGRQLGAAKRGCVAIWGQYPGVHTAFITGPVPGTPSDWYCIGFGHQEGAPDRNTLSGMNEYFRARGHAGVRFLDFEGK